VSSGVLQLQDTIVAIASAPGRGAIALVRLSGPDAFTIAAKHLLPLPTEPRVAHLCDVLSGSEKLDEALVTIFPAPNSFTGDDTVEFSTHGGYLVPSSIVAALTASGARQALPGEFTRRAFLNDKIDLIQAESVADLIDASSAEAAKSAMRSLSGEFSREIGGLVEALTRLRMLIEASLDFPEEEIDFFQENACAPDILGLNYYVTSERWLDESLEKYPHHTHGGNGRERYADTEVVRAKRSAYSGFKKLAVEIWERYGIPMAVTECHLHCTREEQLRWFKEIWDSAVELSNRGIKIKAVTAWAMLGSFDWDTLLTKTGTQYESGVFDIKTFSGQLKPTALTELIRCLSMGTGSIHPVVTESGWWHPDQPVKGHDRPVVIVNAEEDNADVYDSSKLLNVLVAACRHRRIFHVTVSHFDQQHVDKIDPWAVINLRGRGRKIRSLCLRNQLQYVSFHTEEPAGSSLKIVIEQMPANIHQINKVLDLLIDGDVGCWYFSADGMIFKTEDLSGKHHRV